MYTYIYIYIYYRHQQGAAEVGGQEEGPPHGPLHLAPEEQHHERRGGSLQAGLEGQRPQAGGQQPAGLAMRHPMTLRGEHRQQRQPQQRGRPRPRGVPRVLRVQGQDRLPRSSASRRRLADHEGIPRPLRPAAERQRLRLTRPDTACRREPC